MERQCPSGKNKNIINLLSAELAQRVVKVMGNGYTFKRDNSVKIIFTLLIEKGATLKEKELCQNHFYLPYRKGATLKEEDMLPLRIDISYIWQALLNHSIQ